MATSLHKPALAVRTTEDFQTLLVVLLLVLIIGFKLYTVIVPLKDDASQQQDRILSKNIINPAWDYPHLLIKSDSGK